MTERTETRPLILIATNALGAADRPQDDAPGRISGYVHYSEGTVDLVRHILADLGCDTEVMSFSRQALDACLARARAAGRQVAGVIDLFEPSAGNAAIDDLPRALDALGLPHSGSGGPSRIVQRDKHQSKVVARQAGVDTPDWMMVTDLSAPVDAAALDALLPAIIKPNTASVSRSVFLAQTRDEAMACIRQVGEDSRDDVMVERFVPGTEITVVRIGNGATADVVPLILTFERGDLPPSDFIFRQQDKLGQSPKGKRCSWRLARPKLGAATCDELVRLTNLLADAYEGRDMIRIDFRIRPDGAIAFIETNAQPNINDHMGTTTFTINREFYRAPQAVQKQYLRVALERMGVIGPRQAEPAPMGLTGTDG